MINSIGARKTSSPNNQIDCKCILNKTLYLWLLLLLFSPPHTPSTIPAHDRLQANDDRSRFDAFLILLLTFFSFAIVRIRVDVRRELAFAIKKEVKLRKKKHRQNGARKVLVAIKGWFTKDTFDKCHFQLNSLLFSERCAHKNRTFSSQIRFSRQKSRILLNFT